MSRGSPAQLRRLLLGVAGFSVWLYGMYRFTEGNEIEGGLLILGGGAAMLVALSGGWHGFWDGLVNFLWGAGR